MYTWQSVLWFNDRCDFSALLFEPLFLHGYIDFSQVAAYVLPVWQLTLVPSVFGESFFDKAFLHGPASILHPLTIFKWFLYTYTYNGRNKISKDHRSKLVT